MPGEPENQFSLTRAALSTCGAQKQILIIHSYDHKLYEEISHLLILHSELSVLVTYPPRGDFKSLENLQYFHTLIKDSPRAKELDAKRNLLLIFGYCDPLEWTGLVYSNEGWKEIQADEGAAR